MQEYTRLCKSWYTGMCKNNYNEMCNSILGCTRVYWNVQDYTKIYRPVISVVTCYFSSLQDLRACLSHLHSAGFSQPHRTAVWGRSAGGLPVAMLCNLWPHLLQAAVLEVTSNTSFTLHVGTRPNRTMPQYDQSSDTTKPCRKRPT